MERLKAGMKENAVSYLLFLRIVPIFPFWLVNLACRIVGVRLSLFAATTFVGIMPGTWPFRPQGRGWTASCWRRRRPIEACLATGSAHCYFDFSLRTLATPGLMAPSRRWAASRCCRSCCGGSACCRPTRPPRARSPNSTSDPPLATMESVARCNPLQDPGDPFDRIADSRPLRHRRRIGVACRWQPSPPAWAFPSCSSRRRKLGGECLNVGCVPSKALLAAAHAAEAVRSTTPFGIAASKPRIDPARVHRPCSRGHRRHRPQRFRRAVHGDGRHACCAARRSSRTRARVVVGDVVIKARRFVIATGSRPAIPPVPGLAEAPFLTNETIFDLTTRPERLADPRRRTGRHRDGAGLPPPRLGGDRR